MAGRNRTAIYVAAAQAGAEGLGLLRNIFVARALGPSEMGVVAAMTLILSLLDMISDFGPDRLLIQAEDGDRDDFQSTAQTVCLVRGLICAVLLAALAIPASAFLGRPEAAMLIAALGIIPVIRGGLHLDCKRVQRRNEFRKTLFVDLSAAAAATVAAVLAAPMFHSASVLIWVNLLQAIVMVAVSHAVADRPYELGVANDIARRLMRFGWPLAINGLLMFGAMQGDRLVVMASSTAADLGRYAVAFQLTMVPALLISRVASTVWLPALSRCQNDATKFAARFQESTFILGAIALLFSMGILIAGNTVLATLYGPSFQVSSAVIGWLGVMQGVRIMRAAPSLAALSRADSFNQLASNLFRFVGTGAAAVAGLSGGGLEAIAACGCVGEVIALAGSAVLLKTRHQLDIGTFVRSGELYAIGIVSICTLLQLGSRSFVFWLIPAFLSLICGLIACRRIAAVCLSDAFAAFPVLENRS